MIKTIIFDWHGVLDNTRLEDLLKKCAQESGVSFEDVKKLLSGAAREYALGKIPEDEFWAFVASSLHLSSAQVKTLSNYINSIEWNVELWKYLPTLKKEYSFVLLSDSPLEKARKIKSDKRSEIFDVMLFSSEVHLDKKTKEFFYEVSNRVDAEPKDCVFVDDSEKNILFAKSLGFQVYKFINTADFIDYFK
jgi:FMN phosphatase YigB (HAD superfamily)